MNYEPWQIVFMPNNKLVVIENGEVVSGSEFQPPFVGVKSCLFCGGDITIKSAIKVFSIRKFCSHKCDGSYRKRLNKALKY